MLKALWLLFATLTGHWDSHSIPAGSMKPNLWVGDVVISAPASSMPARGDIVFFSHPVTDTDWVKRVIAIAGDTVQMSDGVVILNGEALNREPLGDFVETYERQGVFGSFPRCIGPLPGIGAPCVKRQFEEVLPDGRLYVVLDIEESQLDNTAVLEVPEGHFLVMGDNRDNSTDSRLRHEVGGVGMVPVSALYAKPLLILYSSTGSQTWNPATWREGRFLVPVR